MTAFSPCCTFKDHRPFRCCHELVGRLSCGRGYAGICSGRTSFAQRVSMGLGLIAQSDWSLTAVAPDSAAVLPVPWAALPAVMNSSWTRTAAAPAAAAAPKVSSICSDQDLHEPRGSNRYGMLLPAAGPQGRWLRKPPPSPVPQCTTCHDTLCAPLLLPPPLALPGVLPELFLDFVEEGAPISLFPACASACTY